MFMIPLVSNALRLHRWVTGDRPEDGYYATDGWWIVTLAGASGQWSVYDDGRTG